MTAHPLRPVLLPLCIGASLLLAACEEPDRVEDLDRVSAAEELARGGHGDHGDRARDAYLRLARWYREIYTPPTDFNGDGYADMAAAIRWPFDEHVVVYHGSPTGFPSTPSQIIYSPDPSDLIGFSQPSAAGDVNGDRFDDLIVGAVFDSDVGAAYVFLGSSTGVSSTPDQVLLGSDTGHPDPWAFGAQVTAALDVDRDGYDDVIIGAPNSTGTSLGDGAAFLYRGGPSGLESTPSATFTGTGEIFSGFGETVAVTYVNGDRYPDLVFGESVNQLYGGESVGRVQVHLGSRSGFDTTPDQVITSPDADFAGFGLIVSSVGDVNLDGYGDVIISEPFVDGADGRAFVFLGSRSGLDPVPGLQLDAPAAGRVGYFSWDVSGGGDVDGNGLADLVVGETDARSLAGEAHAFFGPFFVRPGDSRNPRVLTPDATVAGTTTGVVYFGEQVSLRGDVDGNGVDELIVGAPLAGALQRGQVHTFEGARPYSLSGTARQVIEGPTDFGRMGALLTP